MDLNRRDFLRLSGAGLAGAVAFGAMPDTPALAVKNFPLPLRASETQTICCYCSVGCGAIVTVWGENGEGGIKIEGDPDHPINQGSLCPKGMAMYQIHEVEGEVNSERLTRILHRQAGADDWDDQEYDWDQILDMIARRVKETRDAAFLETDENGKRVNRLDRMGSFGGGELDNEECYLLSKMDRALGLTYVEHCARL